MSSTSKATAAQAERLRYFEQRLIEVEARNLGLFHTLDQLIQTVETLTDTLEAVIRGAEPEQEPVSEHPDPIDRPAGLRLVPEIPGHEWEVQA